MTTEHWGVVCGRNHYLGVGMTQAAALEDARRRLSISAYPAASELLATLDESVPMVFVGDYPPNGCIGLMQLAPHVYRTVAAQAEIWSPEQVLTYPKE